LQAFIDASEVWRLSFDNKYADHFVADSCGIFRKYDIDCRSEVTPEAQMRYVRDTVLARPLSMIWPRAVGYLDEAQKELKR
jgi:hypothetical protein